MSKDLVFLLVPIACGCILPIVAILLTVRKKMNDTNKHTQIVLAAIEKNPDMDIEELLRKISPKKKLLKENRREQHRRQRRSNDRRVFRSDTVGHRHCLLD